MISQQKPGEFLAIELKNNQPKVILSKTLFGKEKQIVILHEGQQYQLRLTKYKKLILTK
jgi:hemin uptake protein HemP